LRSVPDEIVLDRTSAVPLYYQLQELLRQQIESGFWGPGDPLPSEPALCRRHAVSRGCVRQALAILEADRAIVRRRGLGTFVAPIRLASGVPGLVRVLAHPGPRAPVIHVLDRRLGNVEDSVRRVLDRPPAAILRLTTRWTLAGLPYAIGVSFLDASVVPRLAREAVAGRDIVPADPPAPLALGDAEVSIETTECGRYEADQLGVAERSTLMVTVSVHTAHVDGIDRAIEVTRLGYVGDRVQLRFHGEPVRDPRPASWAFDP
jgi:GntR family transcriptional regulator